VPRPCSAAADSLTAEEVPGKYEVLDELLVNVLRNKHVNLRQASDLGNQLEEPNQPLVDPEPGGNGKAIPSEVTVRQAQGEMGRRASGIQERPPRQPPSSLIGRPGRTIGSCAWCECEGRGRPWPLGRSSRRTRDERRRQPGVGLPRQVGSRQGACRLASPPSPMRSASLGLESREGKVHGNGLAAAQLSADVGVEIDVLRSSRATIHPC
jgi:hypothetical protein